MDKTMTRTHGVGSLYNFKIDTLSSQNYKNSGYSRPICLRTELRIAIKETKTHKNAAKRSELTHIETVLYY